MKKISLIASRLVLGTVLFTGCAVKTGNDRIENVTQDNILNMIEDGKSTKFDYDYEKANLNLKYTF